jgi:hypothetical protein
VLNNFSGVGSYVNDHAKNIQTRIMLDFFIQQLKTRPAGEEPCDIE